MKLVGGIGDAFSAFIKALKRPLFGVIFQTPQTAGHPHGGYMSESMIEFAARQPEFLEVVTESPVKDFRITTTFWASEDAIRAWESRMGDEPLGYKILISKVEGDDLTPPVA